MSKEKRRDYGTGSIYQRASDGRWIGAVLLAPRGDGRRPRRTVSAKTEAQCKKKVRELQAILVEEGIALGATATPITVEQWAGPWLTRNAKRVRPQSHAATESGIRHWLIPTIGKVRLSRLAPSDFRAVEAAIVAAGRTTSTALRVHVTAMKMLKDAVVEGHAVPQRIFSMPNPAVSTNDRTAIDPDQALDLLKVATDEPSGARWVAALLQGMRQGECLGLTWDCVDLDAKTIDVSWQLQGIPYEHGCGPAVKGKRPCGVRYGGDCHLRKHKIPDGYEMEEIDNSYCLVRPKTSKGKRIIPMVPWMVAALTAWAAIAPRSPHRLVWPQEDGRPTRSTEDRKAWNRLQALAGVRHPSDRPYHLHEARHTTATLLLGAGIDPEVIKAILGHSSIVTSMGYAHVSQVMARKALEDVAAKLQLVAPRQLA